ncbi:dihydropteroate synthase [Saprospira grandis DSM 2844]|uniref:Dihydropteroate synthase n=1 Tax=Saprospira grandis DSM 2844 TaxID=694433 RepID=J0NY39_9BACT|nr:dihydropteroate synthase [Saprospira grandis]EJF52439.1 dihydropteroate synthase [Saprospira grandis DSM 2844]
MQTTINAAGRLLDLSSPKIMGVLNLTPDSFYDGGRYLGEEAYLEQVERMIGEGLDILDIGGASTKPGALAVSAEEELKRILGPLRRIRQEFPDLLISIDSYWAEVIEATAAEGIHLVNDISAGSIDPKLWPVLAKLGLPYVLMHMQGRPETMQDKPQYESVVLEVYDFFVERLGALRQLGVKDIILDLGYGFGKSLGQNYQLLAGGQAFRQLGLPILAGVSRKSMLYKLLGSQPQEVLPATTAAHIFALEEGARILRVHDVEAARQAIGVWQAYQEAKEELKIN